MICRDNQILTGRILFSFMRCGITKAGDKYDFLRKPEHMKNILIHICCAHCLGKILTGLKEIHPEWAPVLFWWNPNIHPLIEYRRRLKAVKMMAERAGLPLIVDDEYGLVDFCRAIHGREAAGERCAICYGLRLNRAAHAAKEQGCAAFTSTLVTSTHQDHAQIRIAGDAAAGQSGVPFWYHDCRDYAADEDLSKMLYRQQYCGCVFSEFDRFQHTRTHLWPPEN